MIVLSSTSEVRRRLLREAGITFKTAKPPVDETTITAALRGSGASACQVAASLAESKAISVAAILPGAFVIGADQMLDCDGQWFDKPVDLAAARRQLLALRGKTHRLVCAAALVAEGKVQWQHAETAELTMRDFSEAWLDLYLTRVGEAILSSVGGYHLEGLGAQLFDKVQGDYFSILGLPLIPLLAALRQAGALPQ
jgi:septum formation protein